MKVPLPIVEGVGPSSQWLPPGTWRTVLDFLQQQFPLVEAATWTSRMERGHVVDETGVLLTPASPYRTGACIYYYRETNEEERIPFAEEILYEDEHILVVDKPHFLPMIPAGRFLKETLLVRLKNQGKPETLVPIHRLDRETAGVVLFSRTPKTRGLYTALFRERKVRKIYEALAPTSSARSDFPLTRRSRIVGGEPFFRMKEIAGEPNTETYIEVIQQAESGDGGGHDRSVNLYQLKPLTGKKHQLRLHLAALGIPIVNDRFYPNYERGLDNEDDFLRPLKLLAKSIAFEDPLTGQERYFESKQELRLTGGEDFRKGVTRIMSTTINMHAARTALNQDSEVRQWVELWLKNKERTTQPALSDEEFDKHWLYVRPERMHEGAIEGVTAYNQQYEG